MALYKYIRENWKKPKETIKELMKARISEWSRGPTLQRIKRPTRLDRARSLGYRAKKGFILVRYRIKRGGKTRPRLVGGRRSKNMRRNLVKNKNFQQMAEERTQRKFPNLEVLNSYPVGKDKTHYYFEIILVDPEAPEIKRDKNINWITQKQHRNRVFRGKTSAGRKSRGLRKKGKGVEKARPSKRSNKNRLN